MGWGTTGFGISCPTIQGLRRKTTARVSESVTFWSAAENARKPQERSPSTSRACYISAASKSVQVNEWITCAACRDAADIVLMPWGRAFGAC